MSLAHDNRTVRLAATLKNNADVAIRLMLEDIHREANPTTPYKEGTLRTMVLKRMESPTHGSITWQAPYAEYQERGYTTGPVQHYTTPGTGAHFAEQAVETVANRAESYFRQAGVIR